MARPDRSEEESASRPPSEIELKGLQKLERLVGRVGEEIKEALELSRLEAPIPPPPRPAVVVHKIETRVEKGPKLEPEPPEPEPEALLEEPFEQQVPQPPQRTLGLLPRLALMLLAMGLGWGALFLWHGYRQVTSLQQELSTQIARAGRTSALLEEAERREIQARLLSEQLNRDLAGMAGATARLQSDLAAARNWLEEFLRERGSLEEIAAGMAETRESATQAQNVSRAGAQAAAEALSLAGVVAGHLDQIGGRLEAMVALKGGGHLLRARAAGDQARWRLGTLDRKDWEAASHPDLAEGSSATLSWPEFEAGRALPRAIRHVLDNQLLLLVGPGEMLLGDESGAGEAEERPEGSAASTLGVRISKPFYVARTELTNARYERFVKASGHPSPPHWGGDSCPAELRQLPLVCVSWEDAQAYCAWAGLRLLTEAEWEYCAKSPWEGVSTGPWPWGKARPSTRLANFDPVPPLRLQNRDWRCWIASAEAHAEGKSPWGILNLAGNVAEWCQDWYLKDWYTVLANREGLPITDPQGPNFGHGRVIRGGSWCSPEGRLRSSARDMAEPSSRYTFLGFRCARDASSVR